MVPCQAPCVCVYWGLFEYTWWDQRPHNRDLLRQKVTVQHKNKAHNLDITNFKDWADVSCCGMSTMFTTALCGHVTMEMCSRLCSFHLSALLPLRSRWIKNAPFSSYKPRVHPTGWRMGLGSRLRRFHLHRILLRFSKVSHCLLQGDSGILSRFLQWDCVGVLSHARVHVCSRLVVFTFIIIVIKQMYSFLKLPCVVCRAYKQYTS